MFKPTHEQIQPGSTVCILLEDDQFNFHEVQGTVEEVLARSNHPLGVEVRLMDGRVGRVQRILNPGINTQHPVGPASPQHHSRAVDQNSYLSTAYDQPQSPWQSSNVIRETPQAHARNQRPTNLEEFSIDGQERSEQVEVMQTYESQVPESVDDMNQATLEKEFPNIDASLIAAIYGDSEDLATTREMLQELGGE